MAPEISSIVPPLSDASHSRRALLKAASVAAGLSAVASLEAVAQNYSSAIVAPPPEFDLRNIAGKNFVTGVRDQGSCNSCTAHAVVAAVEVAVSVKANNPDPQTHLSEDQLFSCAGPGCDTNAWYPDGALDFCKGTGLATYGDFFPRDGLCHQDVNWPLQKISRWQGVNNSAEMKQWISGAGPGGQPSPVISVFVLYQDLYDWNPNNINQVYRHNDRSNRSEVRIGGHVVCIVGYKDNPGYWICKNSWGPSWGGAGKGFFNIAYGDCHIDDYRMYGVVL